MELQDSPPSIPLPLGWVGFRGVKVRVSLDTPKGAMVLDLSVDAMVSLSPQMRGAHLSRNVEALTLALEPKKIYKNIEDYLDNVVRSLLDLHPYSERAKAAATATIYVDLDFAGIRGVEPVVASIAVSLDRSGEKRLEVKASVYGMTVCPSAMDTAASRIGVLPNGVSISHSQKVRLSGSITYRTGFIRVESLAKALWRAFSAPSFTFLKRVDEARLIEAAHKNPQFAEDVARRAIANLYRLAKDRGLPPDTLLEVDVESLESIHPHNVYVHMSARLGDLEEVLGGQVGLSP